MGGQERAVDRGSRLGRAILVNLGAEVRSARMSRGLSQARVGHACGLSQSTIQRVEVGRASGLAILDLSRVLSAVGLDLTARAFPGGSPVRDAGHADLLGRLRAVLPVDTRWKYEVPFPDHGDPRAWDAVIRLSQVRVAIEAETRPRDVQDLLRRMALKRRDGGVDRLVLLLADSRHNRAMLREAGEPLQAAFPIGSRPALYELRDGRPPPDDALVLL
jgi:transcriptional regulator with XRE-family HTH domain